MKIPGLLRSIANVAVIGVLFLMCAMAVAWDWFLMQVMLAVHMNDFGKFYLSAQAFLNGNDMYAPNVATSIGYATARIQYLNMNPPHFHALLIPLALLPPPAALTIWLTLSVSALAISLLLIGRELQMAATTKRVLGIVLVCLASAPSQTFLITGQLSLLLMLPVTLAWLDARHGRWGRAGAWLGVCMSVKPFFLIFIPYLLLTRRTRSLITAMRGLVVCFALGILIFGRENYRSWFRAVAVSSDWAWASMNASVLAFFQRTFERTPYFVPVWFAPRLVWLWLVVAGVIGIATLVVAIKDRSDDSVDRAFALLLVASQLVSPLGWIYYLWLPAGPIGALAANRMRKPGTATPPVLVLTAVSMCGLFVPPTALFLFQPLRWATAIVASAYFWAAASLWGCVMLDFAWSGQTSQETAIEASSMADLNEAASSHSGTE